VRGAACVALLAWRVARDAWRAKGGLNSEGRLALRRASSALRARKVERLVSPRQSRDKYCRACVLQKPDHERVSRVHTALKTNSSVLTTDGRCRLRHFLWTRSASCLAPTLLPDSTCSSLDAAPSPSPRARFKTYSSPEVGAVSGITCSDARAYFEPLSRLSLIWSRAGVARAPAPLAKQLIALYSPPSGSSCSCCRATAKKQIPRRFAPRDDKRGAWWKIIGLWTKLEAPDGTHTESMHGSLTSRAPRATPFHAPRATR